MTKIYAFYLPQFHRTQENDEWWGEGFTEWTTVKGAKPLFPGHEKPDEPLDYYNLLEKHTMKNQADLMHEYGVDGMCFYHYYFENGKKILEKPAENLLEWTEIDMPFCFYWANQSWVRTWSNMQEANVWTSTSEKNEKHEGDGVLLRQAYGTEEQWKAHFDYLLPFFKDSRYIKKNGRPVFMIYKPEDIKCLAEMKKCWNTWMEAEGLPSIYFLGKNTYAEVLDGYMDHEPQFALTEMASQKFSNDHGMKQLIEYDDVWNRILKNHEVGDQYYYGGFVGYDDSPRHGNRGTVIKGQTPKKFKKYMICLLTKAYHAHSDMVFLNAWNEWGEGMYLEPDRKNKDAYLKALKEAKTFVAEHHDILSEIIVDNMAINEKAEREKIDGLVKKNERYREYWLVLRDWLYLNVQGKSITKYLIDHNMKEVAIYGMGMLGTPLYEELVKNGFDVLYGIDQDRAKDYKFDLPVYTLTEELPKVEVIIVTVGYAFESIKEKILEKDKFTIISLEEIVEYAAR